MTTGMPHFWEALGTGPWKSLFSSDGVVLGKMKQGEADPTSDKTRGQRSSVCGLLQVACELETVFIISNNTAGSSAWAKAVARTLPRKSWFSSPPGIRWGMGGVFFILKCPWGNNKNYGCVLNLNLWGHPSNSVRRHRKCASSPAPPRRARGDAEGKRSRRYLNYGPVRQLFGWITFCFLFLKTNCGCLFRLG